jgi:starch synthase
VHFDDASTRAFSLLYMLPRTAVVTTIHNPRPFMGEEEGRFELVRRRFVARSKLLMFHSEHSRHEYLAHSGAGAGIQTAVVHLGVFDVYQELCGEAPPTDSTALFFGRIGPYKGIDVLYQAAPAVAAQVAGAKFVIAGRPGGGVTLDTPPELPNGGSWEIITRLVPLPEMCALFQRADVVILPYLQAWQSGVVSTAFAFAKPVVATAVGGIPEVVEDGVTGWLVPPRDPDALAERVTQVLLDKALRARMQDNIAAAAAGPLSWATLAGIALGSYERVVGRS